MQVVVPGLQRQPGAALIGLPILLRPVGSDHPAARPDEPGYGRNETRMPAILSTRRLAERHDV